MTKKWKQWRWKRQTSPVSACQLIRTRGTSCAKDRWANGWPLQLLDPPFSSDKQLDLPLLSDTVRKDGKSNDCTVQPLAQLCRRCNWCHLFNSLAALHFSGPQIAGPMAEPMIRSSVLAASEIQESQREMWRRQWLLHPNGINQKEDDKCGPIGNLQGWMHSNKFVFRCESQMECKAPNDWPYNFDDSGCPYNIRWLWLVNFYVYNGTYSSMRSVK